MVTDALAPSVARSSAAMVHVFTMEDKRVLVIQEKGFQLSAPSQYRVMIEKCNYIFMFPETNSVCVGLTYRAGSRLAPSQWKMLLQSNAVSHWLGANLESALTYHILWVFPDTFIWQDATHTVYATDGTRLVHIHSQSYLICFSIYKSHSNNVIIYVYHKNNSIFVMRIVNPSGAETKIFCDN